MNGVSQTIRETIQVKLLSDAAFGRGEGTAGAVDVEVEHDDFGLPFLSGKTLRGLLRDSWLSMQSCFQELTGAAHRVFGPSASCGEDAILRIGDAMLGDDVRAWVEAAETRDRHPVSSAMVLESLTEIRWQTSISRKTGASDDKTLRAVRVIVRGLTFKASALWLEPPGPMDRQCLALALLATRHAGLSRNRGMGRVLLTLNGDLEKTKQIAKGGGV